MDYQTRYDKLNTAQQQAVDTLDGPVMVVAGPGTGKTELLSMRAANILRSTDALPETILCLTFTESGAAAMRKRMGEIIGKDAYKIAVHTFHSFGSDIMGKHREFFYEGAELSPADDLATYEIASKIFAGLDYKNPLAGEWAGEYTYLSDTLGTISDIKRAGLTPDKFRLVLEHNAAVIDAINALLTPVLDIPRINKSVIPGLADCVAPIRALATPIGVPNFTPLAQLIANSLQTALDEAEALDGKTTPITAWKNRWIKPDAHKKPVLKAGDQLAKLFAVADVYEQYVIAMNDAKLFDFNDMIMNVVQAIEQKPELRYELQETYQYIMVDEFQDTNLAQLRIVQLLADSPVNEGRPNILVVGDDDQAVYGFQGAEIGNILGFKDMYRDVTQIPLTINYRSTEQILTPASEVAVQIGERLATRLDGLDKTIAPFATDEKSLTRLIDCETADDERRFIAEDIARLIADGTPAEDIAVLARKHAELEQLLPYLAKQHITVNYEKRDDVLELPVITHLELLARIVTLLAENRHDEADSLLPQLLAHPAWKIAPVDVWKLSLAAKHDRVSWMEAMSTRPECTSLHAWLVDSATRSLYEPLERMIDHLFGIHLGVADEASDDTFTSPLYDYFFSPERQETAPDDYLTYLEALRTIRTKLRDHQPEGDPRLIDFLEFIQLHRKLGKAIASLRPRAEHLSGAVQLMTAHASKGLEFPHVYVCGVVDNNWGERVRGRSSNISYPENMPLRAHSGTLDERLRLFFVAMTRAERHLTISFSRHSSAGKETLPASFLAAVNLTPEKYDIVHTTDTIKEELETLWYQPLIDLHPRATMAELLAPTLERYRLSATHVGAFLDVTRGGPQGFLLNHLLRFPSAKSAQAAYGTAVHAALQRAHQYLTATGRHRAVEDILHDYEELLTDQYLPPHEYDLYLEKGSASLQAFLEQHYADFTSSQKPELDFSAEHVRVGEVHLTGKLDVVDIDKESKTIRVMDYKTGKPASDWKGKTDYEKAKLHRYRQQLLFYKLLVEHSSSYGSYTVERGILQFVEPDLRGIVPAIDASFTREEVEEFTRLIEKIWQHITTLDLPDTSGYSQDFAGILAFERDLLD